MATAKKTTKPADSFESMMNINPDAFKEGYEKMAESMTVFADFQKGSVEAMMTSAGAFAKGFEKMAAEQTAFTKAAFEDSAAMAQAATSSGNPQEAFEMTTDYVRKTLETSLGQVSKVADIWMETSKETVEPMSVRYGELVEKIQSFRP